jgi:hypothetical protein
MKPIKPSKIQISRICFIYLNNPKTGQLTESQLEKCDYQGRKTGGFEALVKNT